MVVQGDFKVQIVEAGSKKPFREHHKDGQVFVEVEPDAEFFLSVQKVGACRHLSGLVMVKPFVDDQRLGWRKSYLTRRTDDKPDYFGLFRRNRTGSVATQALKFVRPGLDIDKVTIGTGKVEVKIYESQYLGETRKRRKKQSRQVATMRAQTINFKTEKVSPKESIRLGMKCIRAKAGTKKIPEILSIKRHKPTRLIDVITLNYSSLPGLMYAGILPMPSDLYACHKIFKGVRNEEREDKEPEISSKQVSVTQIVRLDDRLLSQSVKFYDLYEVSDDSQNGQEMQRNEYGDSTRSCYIARP